MKINQDNYEQFFLDYAEGSLSPEMEKELSYFLEANPDLRPVLDDYDPSPIQTDDISNDRLKARLKKYLIFTAHIKDENVDDWMIRDIEGLLDESKENELKEFLSLNPAYSFDYKIFGYTKLSPDLSITYSWKKELKKNPVVNPLRRLAWLVPAAAAVLLLFIGIRYLSQPEIQTEHPVAPVIAVIPSLSSPGIVINGKESALPQKNLVKIGTPSHVRVNTSRMKALGTKEIALFNPTSQISLKLADYDSPPIIISEKKNRSLVGKIFGNLVAHAREGLGNNAKLEKISKSDFSFWSIAKAGINGYNSLSDRDLKLYVRKDEEGKVKSYALVEQERLILSKDLNKN